MGIALHGCTDYTAVSVAVYWLQWLGLRSAVVGLRAAVAGLRAAVAGLRAAVVGLRAPVAGLY